MITCSSVFIALYSSAIKVKDSHVLVQLIATYACSVVNIWESNEVVTCSNVNPCVLCTVKENAF